MSMSDAIAGVVQTISLGDFIALAALCVAGLINPRGVFLAVLVVLLLVRFA